jgi:hypothetical protein
MICSRLYLFWIYIETYFYNIHWGLKWQIRSTLFMYYRQRFSILNASHVDFSVTSQGLILIGSLWVIYSRAAVLNCILMILGGDKTTKIILYSLQSFKNSFFTLKITGNSWQGLVKFVFNTILFSFYNFSMVLYPLTRVTLGFSII